MASPDRVAIIGGEGAMGRLTTKLFQKLGYETVVSDIANPNTPTAIEAIRTCRIVFLSVLPLQENAQIVQAAESSISENHVFIDNATVKEPLEPAFEILIRRHASACSTHPLCSDEQPWNNQKAYIMGIGSKSAEAVDLSEMLYQSAGMVILHMDIKNHDSTMLANQYLTHLLQRSNAEAIFRSGIDIEALWKIATPNTQLLILSLFRTDNQNPKISGEIILRHGPKPAARQYVESLHESLNTISGQTDLETLAQHLQETTESLASAEFRSRMTEISTAMLEGIANLEGAKLIVTAPEDIPGVLENLGGSFARSNVNLTEIRSHILNGSVMFYVGYSKDTSPHALNRAINRLQKRGFGVAEIRYTNN